MDLELGVAPEQEAGTAGPWPCQAGDDAAAAVTALYLAYALSLTRLAHIMLGDMAAAEDVVQDAFCGLYRRWEHLSSKNSALAYVRSSVLNGCRTALRRSKTRETAVSYEPAAQPPAISAEAAVLSAEERREVARALRQLPDRQREVLVLQYYLDLPDEQIARDLEIRPSTIRSARRRGLASMKRKLKEGA